MDLQSDSDWTDMEDSSISLPSSSEGDSSDYSNSDESSSEGSTHGCSLKPKGQDTWFLLLPIGVGHILWDHFGFPVFKDKEFCTKIRAVVCSHCNKGFRFCPGVFSKMRTHLQECNEDLFNDLVAQELTTPWKKISQTPFVVVNSKVGDGLYDKCKKITPPSLEDKLKREDTKEYLLWYAIDNLRPGLAADDSPFVKFTKDYSKDPSSFPSLGEGESFVRNQMPARYEEVKNKLRDILQKCSEYSMCVEEWKSDYGTHYLTFSINRMTAKGLKNHVLLTTPKDLEELPEDLRTIWVGFGVDQMKVVAVISNTNINFAEYWNANAKTQFIPCFPKVMKNAIKKLCKLVPVEWLLQKLNLDPEKFEDCQVLLHKIEHSFWHIDDGSRDLTASEKQLLTTVMEVVRPLRLAMNNLVLEDQATLVSMLWPIIYTLQTKYLAPDSADCPMLASMKQVVLETIKNSYTPVKQFLQTVALLDPRFRQLIQVMETEASKTDILGHTEAVIIKGPTSNTPSFDPTELAKLEYFNFKKEQPVDFMVSPLLWWDTSEAIKMFPHLRQVAWMFNCVPICCVPMDRFKSNDLYHEEYRAALDSADVDPMLFLHSNLLITRPDAH